MIQFSNEVWGLVPISASLVYKYSELTFKKNSEKIIILQEIRQQNIQKDKLCLLSLSHLSSSDKIVVMVDQVLDIRLVPTPNFSPANHTE